MYILEVNHGGGEIHRHFLLPGQTYTLGRKECRILLPAAEPSISRHHATITVAPMPRYSVLDPTAQLEIKIEDVSKHGTFVDRERVGKDNTRFLYPEDRIRLGLRVTARIIPMVLVIGISPDLTDENLDLVLDSAVHVGALVVEDAIPAPMTYYEQHANSVGFLYVAEDGFAMEETMMQALGYGYTLVTPSYVDHLVRALEEQDTLMPSEFPTPSSPSPGSMGLRAVHYRRPAQTFFSVTEFLSIGRPIVANVFERYTFLLLSETLREVYAAVLQLFGGVVEALTGDGAIAAWRAAHPQSGAYPQTTCVLVGEEDFRAVSEAVMERGSGRGDFDATHTHPTITGYLTLYKLGVCLIPEENVHLALYRSDSAELTTKATACYLQRTAEDVLADSSSSSATTPAPAASPHATAASVPASPPPPPAIPVAATASRDSLASSTDGTAAKPASSPAPATAAAVVASPPAEGAAVAANPQHRRSLSNSHHSAAEPSATAPHPRPHAGVAHLTAVQARRSREAVHSPPASSSTSRERSTSKPSAAAAVAAATASPSGTVHSPANPPVIALRSSASPKRAGSPDFSSQQQSPRGGGAAGGVPVTTVPALSSIVARAPSANGAAAVEGAAEVRLSSTPVAPTALHLSRSGSNSGSGSFNTAATAADAAAGAKASPRAPSASPPAPAAATASGGSLASSMTRQPETDAAAATTPAAATSREASTTAPPPATSASSNQRSTPADTTAAHPHAANALSREPSESAAPPARGRLVGRRASHPFSLTNRLRHGESHPSSDDDNDESAEQPKAPSAPADGNGAAQESESAGATAAAAAHAQSKRASQPSARRASTSVRRGSLGAQPSPVILPLKSEEVVRPRTRTASGSQPSAYASAVAALGRRSAAQSEERQAEESASAPRRSASTDPQAHGVPPLPPSGVATTATTAPLLHRAASRTSAASNSATTTSAGAAAAGKSGSGGAASPSSHASVRRGEQRLASASAPAPRRSLTRASAALASASRERSASPQQSRLKAKRLPSPEKDVVVHHATQVGKSPPRQRVEAVRITATPSSSARRMSVTREAEASVPRHGDPTASNTNTAAAAVAEEEVGPGSMGNRRSVVRRESVSRQGAMGGGPLTRRASSSFQRSDSAQLREMATPHRLTSRVSSSVPRTRRAKAYGSVQRQRSLEPAGEESAEAEGSPLNSSRVSIRRRRGSPTQSGATNNNSATASGVFSLNVSASNGGGSSSGGGGSAVVPGQIPGLRGGSAAPMAGGAGGATAEAHFRANDELNTNCQKFMKEFVDDFMTETERVTRSVVRQTYMDAASKETLEGGVERILEFLQYVNSTESDIPSMYSTSNTRAACHQVRQKSQYALSKIKACYKTVSCKIPSSLTRARAALSTRNVSPTQRRLHAASGTFDAASARRQSTF